jgi:hypothetical protein
MGGERKRATGRSEVKTSPVVKFDEATEGPTLAEVYLTETFTGAIRLIAFRAGSAITTARPPIRGYR